jgi:hypothetical protein
MLTYFTKQYRVSILVAARVDTVVAAISVFLGLIILG